MRSRALVAIVAAGVAGIAGVVGVTVVSAVAADDSSDLGSVTAELLVQQGSSTVTWAEGDPVAPGEPEIGALLAAGASSVDRVVLGAGCRVFDTRFGAAPGVLAAGTSKDFSVTDAAIPAQGGSASGCGIPADAVAVDLSLSTVGNTPTAAGFLRVGPGGTTPTATVLQFLAGQGTSVGTSTKLSATETLRVAAFVGSTHLVGDVLAYYRGPLHATVASDGVLFSGAGVASVTKSTSAGTYFVNFDRDISECVPAISGAFGLPAWGLILDADSVGVVTSDWAGTATDGAFHVTMSC
jgi:hypothetical protein